MKRVFALPDNRCRRPMCRWIAYRGTPLFLETLLFEPENSLVRQSLHCRKATVTTNGDGFGVGWYGDRDTPCVYRETLPAWNDQNLRQLAHHIRSPLFFGHVRASTGTGTARVNCHPFSLGRWLFMHNGQIGGWDHVRRRLESLLTDDLYTARQGATDSELFFLLLFLHGLEDDPLRALAATAATVRRTMESAGVTEPLRLTAALTDGRRIVAVRYASDRQPPSLYWRRRNGQVVIVSEPLDQDNADWVAVEDGHGLLLDEDMADTPFVL